MKIVSVFLTYDYSLETWEKNGTLNRELKIFKEIAKSENIKFKFISYDKGFVLNSPDLQQYIEIISIYKNLKDCSQIAHMGTQIGKCQNNK